MCLSRLDVVFAAFVAQSCGGKNRYGIECPYFATRIAFAVILLAAVFCGRFGKSLAGIAYGAAVFVGNSSVSWTESYFFDCVFGRLISL